MPVSGSNSNYTITGNSPADIGYQLITRDYLIDVYPNLIGTFKQAGLWGWGHNQYGSLGDNTTTHRSSPVQTVSSGTNWKSICFSGTQSGTQFAAIKTDGTLWTWGHNHAGQLGDNTITHRSSPIQTVSTGTNWKQVGCGTDHIAAIKTDGTLWTWGSGSNGQLGNNASTSRSSPVQTVSGGTNWKQVSCGGLVSAAIKTDGTLWLWGYAFDGQLGNGSLSPVGFSSPVQTVSTGTNWKQVSCGYNFVSAIKTDGTLWSWGLNTQGTMGDPGITASKVSSPVQTVSGGTNWKQVASGSLHVVAIKTDGTLWTWGYNLNGGLGDNTVIKKSSPIQTVSSGTNWKLAGAGLNASSAIKTDGTLWVWGVNSMGGLGDNTTIHRSSPVQTVAGGSNWKFVSGANYFTFAIRDDSADIFGYPT